MADEMDSEFTQLLNHYVWPNGLVLGQFDTVADAVQTFDDVIRVIVDVSRRHTGTALIMTMISTATLVSTHCADIGDHDRSFSDEMLKGFVSTLTPRDLERLTLYLLSMIMARAYRGAHGDTHDTTDH